MTEADEALRMVTQYALDLRNSLDGRNEAIRLARREGVSFGRIAAAAKLTPQGVRKIVAKTDHE